MGGLHAGARDAPPWAGAVRRAYLLDVEPIVQVQRWLRPKSSGRTPHGILLRAAQ